MRALLSTESPWRDPILAGFWIAVSAALTVAFTCITPFVAFAVLAAATLSGRGAFGLTLGVWLANQVVGYCVLSYPWDRHSAAWGVALGGAAIVATVAARWIVAPGRASLARVLAAFVAAFVVNQGSLYVVAVTVLGGAGAYVPAIVGRVLVLNAVALLGLWGASQLAIGLGLVPRADRLPATRPVA